MFKLSWKKMRGAEGCQKQDWQNDPSGHPALLVMSTRELADLPMVPEVPMWATKGDVAALDSRHGIGREITGGCVVSR
ncbi:MAG: hypothetical protein QE284_03515 [Rhizobium sp.]|nr:hypothetical protein [Rhizobium sp.]